jgi:hypothetical protein
MKRRLVFLATVGLLAFASTAVGAPPVVNETDHEKQATDTFLDVNPCTGDAAQITITYNSVFHITQFANGTEHVTGTMTGTALIDTVDPALPDFSGHFTQWFGGNGNTKSANGTFTFTVNAKGTDGSRLRFHETAHFSVNANGDLTVEFDKITCG